METERFDVAVTTAFPSASNAIPLLSRRELEVLNLLGRGNTDKEVAAHCSISLGTVRVYRKRILAKYHCHGLVESLLIAWRHCQLDLFELSDEVMAKRHWVSACPGDSERQE